MKYRKISDLLIHPPRIVKRLLDTFTWRINTDSKELYLTFDDGPIPEITPQLLHLLHAYDAKATFFCVGDNVRKYPELYQAILDQGHTVGNHCFSHLNSFKTDADVYIADVEKAAQYIDSKLFRPPYGKLKPVVQSKLAQNFDLVLWDVLTYDFDKRISPEKCFGNVKQFARRGSIIVFHENLKAKDNMFYALTQTLMYFSEQLYTFKALPPTLSANEKRENVGMR